MTTLIATSVLRDRRRGEFHAGAFLVDLDGHRAAPILEEIAARPSRPVSIREGGLRGLAFDGHRVFAAGRDALFVFSPQFELLGSYRSPYLKHCQGICHYKDRLFLVSAGCDSILGFDLERMRFSLGLHLVADDEDFRAMPFDPAGQKGPQFANRLQLNKIYCDAQGMFVSGRLTHGVLSYGGRKIVRFATLPRGAHDARPWREGILFNDSEAGAVRYVTPECNHVFRVPKIPDGDIETGPDQPRSAPPALARGLCPIDENRIVSGSSPATITLHDVAAMQTVLTINLSADPRVAVYGLEVWPFSG